MNDNHVASLDARRSREPVRLDAAVLALLRQMGAPAHIIAQAAAARGKDDAA